METKYVTIRAKAAYLPDAYRRDDRYVPKSLSFVDIRYMYFNCWKFDSGYCIAQSNRVMSMGTGIDYDSIYFPSTAMNKIDNESLDIRLKEIPG